MLLMQIIASKQLLSLFKSTQTCTTLLVRQMKYALILIQSQEFSIIFDCLLLTLILNVNRNFTPFIHSFTQAISIVPLQVHYYSEALPT